MADAHNTLSVTASGMVTAVGFNAISSLAAMRAGISGIRQLSFWDTESGDFISGAKVDLPHWWVGLGKFSELVAPAIHECIEAAGPIAPEEIPIVLCVASHHRPHRIQGLDDKLLQDVEFKLSISLHPQSMIIAEGGASLVSGLRHAARLIMENRIRYCIIAGVDSFLEQNLIDYYIQNRRLNTEKNSNGFSPGEAGSAILLARSDLVRTSKLEITGIGQTKEKSTIESEEPLRGEGMITAVRQALSMAGISFHDVAYRITDINGEHYKFKEAMLVALRFEREARPNLRDLWHPIELIGDVGAAIGPIVLAQAFHASKKGYAPGDIALCHFGDDGEERSAVVVQFRGRT